MNKSYSVDRISEIFPIDHNELNLLSFRISPNLDKKLGNRFSWRFSQKFLDIVVIWHEQEFWAIAKPDQKLPSQAQWKEALAEIQKSLREDIGNIDYSIQWIRQPQVTPIVLSKLVIRILKNISHLLSTSVISKNKIEVKRLAKFWPESFEVQGVIKPAISLTLESNILYSSDLEQFYNNHPYRQDAQELLVGLKVREIEKGGYATILALAGTIGERREELKERATGAVSKQKLEEAPDNQPVVSVQFGKNTQRFDYAMAALCPQVTDDTAERFDVEYGELLQATKISYLERQRLLKTYRKQALNFLNEYGLIMQRSINSQDYESLFYYPKNKIEDIPLLFGNNYRGKKSAVLVGLSNGGVYRRHTDFQDSNRPIRLAILKVIERGVGNFRSQLQKHLKRYGFDSILPDENTKSVSVQGLSDSEARAKVEDAVDELMVVPPDIVLVFLPQSDRNADNTEGGSLYTWIYSRLLRRQIASQFIYEKTISNPEKYRFILNQVVPGILAKLGNLPFILAEPLEIADYFIGLDISRSPKKRLTGSMNACASIRIYGQKGDFLGYRIEDSLIEGEEIPQRTLEAFFPKADLKDKTVLIYRDGLFRGQEVNHLLARAKVINAKFILVECSKSYIPRLYNFAKLSEQDQGRKLTSPDRGLALHLSPREGILVTTQVSNNVGVPKPLRLKIHEQGEQVSLQSAIETTLKLTLLHHGALKDPRLPLPLFGSDRIAKRRLQGIYPGAIEGDRQFWL